MTTRKSVTSKLKKRCPCCKKLRGGHEPPGDQGGEAHPRRKPWVHNYGWTVGSAITTAVAGKILASEYMQDDPAVRCVYQLEHDTEVRLIVVTSSVHFGCGVLPFRVVADPPDVPFKALTVHIHPQDWEDRRHELDWPESLDPETNSVKWIAPFGLICGWCAERYLPTPEKDPT